MKTNFLFLTAATLFISCSTNKLSEEQAKQLITKYYGYPKAFTFEVNRIDPESVQRLDNAGLESAGMVTLVKKWSFDGITEPKIFFTEKAKPYLTGPSKGEASEQSENVKVADTEMGEITGIAISKDGQTAKAEYTIYYKNIAPFKVLIQKPLEKPQEHTAYFRRYEDGWRVDKTAEASMLFN